MAAVAASTARLSPVALPIPMSADPVLDITARISAKSTLIMPGAVINSEIPSTAWRRISSQVAKALLSVVFLSIIENKRSFGMTIRASTSFSRSSNPFSAMRILCWPSKKNGLVTTATVKTPCSLAIRAMIGDAPVPVPPPIPQAMKTISAPLTISCISSLLSSAERLPISGSIPEPNPFVEFFPM